MNKRVLVACEESQIVTKEFRRLGVEAFSCDILPCSGGEPQWHIQDDVRNVLKENNYNAVIAFPPCTHLASSGARWFPEKRKDGRQQSGIDFFMFFVNLDVEKVVIENPVGIMSTIYRKPDQIINPYQFGDSFMKNTCLWIKGLPKLKHTNLVERGQMIKMSNGKFMNKFHYDTFKLPANERSRVRSKTFPGIAKAMAEQWYSLL